MPQSCCLNAYAECDLEWESTQDEESLMNWQEAKLIN